MGEGPHMGHRPPWRVGLRRPGSRVVQEGHEQPESEHRKLVAQEPEMVIDDPPARRCNSLDMAHGEGHESGREEGEDEGDLGNVSRGHQVDSAGEPACRGVGREKYAQRR